MELTKFEHISKYAWRSGSEGGGSQNINNGNSDWNLVSKHMDRCVMNKHVLSKI